MKKTASAAHVLEEKEKLPPSVGIGEHLTAIRTKKKLSVQDVVNHTKIRAVYVQAMEREDFEALPPGIYTRAYLRSYATYLGVDGTDVLDRLDAQTGQKTKEEDTLLLEPHRESFRPSRLILGISLGLALITYLSWSLWQGRQQTGQNPAADISATHAQQTLNVYTNPDPVVSLVALRPAHITLIGTDGAVIAELALEGGDVYFPPEQAGLVLKTEDVQALAFYVSGDPVASLDNLERTTDGLVLDVTKLLASVVIQHTP